jgi:hypothetical protein
MKKAVILLALFAFSCKKEYTCECQHSNTIESHTFKAKQRHYSEIKAWCEGMYKPESGVICKMK